MPNSMEVQLVADPQHKRLKKEPARLAQAFQDRAWASMWGKSSPDTQITSSCKPQKARKHVKLPRIKQWHTPAHTRRIPFPFTESAGAQAAHLLQQQGPQQLPCNPRGWNIQQPAPTRTCNHMPYCSICSTCMRGGDQDSDSTAMQGNTNTCC